MRPGDDLRDVQHTVWEWRRHRCIVQWAAAVPVGLTRRNPKSQS